MALRRTAPLTIAIFAIGFALGWGAKAAAQTPAAPRVSIALHADYFERFPHRAIVRRAKPRRPAILEQAPRPRPSPRPLPPPPAGSCLGWIHSAGITDPASAYPLIMRESGCRPNAVNRYSGACGIPQANPCAKLGAMFPGDPVGQLRWMDGYVMARYGSWAAALAHSYAYGWY
jgi:hypothetical protein